MPLRRIYPTEGEQEAEQLSRAARNPRDEGLEERRRTTAPAHVPHTTLKISQIEKQQESFINKDIYTC